jgi:hypothetical protein
MKSKRKLYCQYFKKSSTALADSDERKKSRNKCGKLISAQDEIGFTVITKDVS